MGCGPVQALVQASPSTALLVGVGLQVSISHFVVAVGTALSISLGVYMCVSMRACACMCVHVHACAYSYVQICTRTVHCIYAYTTVNHDQDTCICRQTVGRLRSAWSPEHLQSGLHRPASATGRPQKHYGCREGLHNEGGWMRHGARTLSVLYVSVSLSLCRRQ